MLRQDFTTFDMKRFRFSVTGCSVPIHFIGHTLIFGHQKTQQSHFSFNVCFLILVNRRLRCARNFIHIQLFITFILKAMAVFIRDATLFSNDDTNHCTLSTVRLEEQEALGCIRNSCLQSSLFSYLCIILPMQILCHTNPSSGLLCAFFSSCLFSQFTCKASVVFCHYCVMANFFWLLVEALYLNSLLLSSFYHSRQCLWGFSLLGWGEKP